ncbi:hypothetical protein [Paraliomyxa miuraensis]|uniref:hypothetical protein n=1 Tax=Paraliomyxa miuraensis TaxID=376150 RepID=UPI00225A15B1|nr:hypothetical protein [Paraliomyxa miuraensis]MCX4243985.1 hypothetical protein [Paraliomyxa miuraensis]
MFDAAKAFHDPNDDRFGVILLSDVSMPCEVVVKAGRRVRDLGHVGVVAITPRQGLLAGETAHPRPDQRPQQVGNSKAQVAVVQQLVLAEHGVALGLGLAKAPVTSIRRPCRSSLLGQNIVR